MNKPLLVSLAVLAALSTLAWLPTPPAPATPTTLGGGEACRRAAEADAKVAAEGRRGLFFAVLEGLYTEGASNAAVDAVLAVDPKSGLPANFVKGCPICMPAYDAFRAYRGRPDGFAMEGAFGDGLAAEDEAALRKGGDVCFQRSGKLVQGWIARWLERQKLTDDERAAWSRAMEDWRKKGMASLEEIRTSDAPGVFAGRKTCSMCEAANDACKR